MTELKNERGTFAMFEGIEESYKDGFDDGFKQAIINFNNEKKLDDQSKCNSCKFTNDPRVCTSCGRYYPDQYQKK